MENDSWICPLDDAKVAHVADKCPMCGLNKAEAAFEAKEQQEIMMATVYGSRKNYERQMNARHF